MVRIKKNNTRSQILFKFILRSTFLSDSYLILIICNVIGYLSLGVIGMKKLTHSLQMLDIFYLTVCIKDYQLAFVSYFVERIVDKIFLQGC